MGKTTLSLNFGQADFFAGFKSDEQIISEALVWLSKMLPYRDKKGEQAKIYSNTMLRTVTAVKSFLERDPEHNLPLLRPIIMNPELKKEVFIIFWKLYSFYLQSPEVIAETQLKRHHNWIEIALKQLTSKDQ